MRIFHLHKDPNQEGDAKGITLLEVIVALMILAIIMVPLVMAFTSGLITSGQSRERLDKDGDMARITEAWNRDVVDVDPTGVFDTGLTGPQSVNTAPCVDPTQPASTPLVSFASDIAVSAGSTPRLATWSIEGSGVDAKLVRTICFSGAPVSYAVIASSFGEVGGVAANMVRGPGGAGTQFCTGRSCTIEIHGAYDFGLTVSRRVPDLSASALANAAPPPPRIISLTPQDSALGASWNPPELVVGQPPVDQYEIQVLTSPTGPVVKTVTGIDGNAVGTVISGLTNGTQYWVSGRAHNSVGWGIWGNVYGPAVPRPMPPGGPTITSINRCKTQTDSGGNVSCIGDQTLEASWSAMPGATGYRLYARDPSGRELGPVEVSGTTGRISGLTNGIQYNLLVSSVNANGEGNRGTPSTAARPVGKIPNPVSVTARASGSKTISVDVTMPKTSEDQWVSLNGNQLLNLRFALYAINPTNGSYTYVGGYWDRKTGDAGFTGSYPTYSYTWQQAGGDGAIKDGTSYVFRVRTTGIDEINWAPTKSEGNDSDSVPGYANALNPPGVTPAGPPNQTTPACPDSGNTTGLLTNVHYYQARSDQKIDVQFDGPSTTCSVNLMLNGGRAVAYQAQMDERPAGTTGAWSAYTGFGASAAPITTLTLADNTTIQCTWCNLAPVDRPTASFDRVVYNIGPLYGTKHYRLGMRIATRGEWPGSAVVWGPYSTYCGGNAPDNGCVVAGPGPGETPTVAYLYRNANSAPGVLNMSFKAPATTPSTGYKIICSSPGIADTTFTKTAVTAPGATVTETLTGLQDGRNYRCSVQMLVAAVYTGAALTSNLEVPYGECRLTPSLDTWIEQGSGSNNGADTTLRVGRKGAWYEAYSEANRAALVKWAYTDNCTNYGSSNIAMSANAYLVNSSLNMTITSGTNRDNRVYLATSSWDNSTTWGNQPTAGASPGVWSASGGGLRTIDVLSQSRTQKAGTNFGWVIKDDGGNAYNYTARYGSREWGQNTPYLQIKYYNTGLPT